ncbi:growth hormone secretagogue receptor type 1-like [Ylistrum balloti]|uniref:growth hormone secretagogue receptor type 1-like n=1 Tax=Ylistrum balloti TaxID=509963 RepID=UPI002905C3A6|nr:growth hormone secretagogue receptor type 1-like [Ylistrum balloti]
MNQSLNWQRNIDSPVAATVLTEAASNLSGAAFVETSMYIYIWVTIVNGIIFLTGVIGNAMVIVVVVKVRDMRTTTNYFLVNLSIADLLVLLICQPSALLEFYAKDRWYIGKALCKAIPLLENAVVHASVLTILAITTERFNAICFPLKRTLKFKARVVAKIIGVIWTLSCLTAIPFVFMTTVEDAIFYDGSPCQVCRTKVEEAWQYGYLLSMLSIFFAVPLFVLVFMYAKIIRCLIYDSTSILSRKNPSSIYNIRTRHQVVRMLVAIVLLFFLSMFPLRVVTLWVIFAPPNNVEALGMEGYFNLLAFVRVMFYLNSAGNPVIYSLTSTKFKLAVKRVWGTYSPANGQPLYRNTQHMDGKDISLQRFTTNQLDANSNNSRRICGFIILVMREEYLRHPRYDGILEVLMENMEKTRKWKIILKRIIQKYFAEEEGVAFVYKKA